MNLSQDRSFFLVLLVAALPILSVRAASESDADRTLKVRAILHKYCAECHQPGNSSMGDLSVLDRDGMNRADRPFIMPGAADASQLLQLIEDGSMPPGSRPKPSEDERKTIREWINADALSYPRNFDDEYVLASILADVRKLPESERPFFRYFSLSNQIPDADIGFQLETIRQTLRSAIADMSKSKSATVTGIDPLQSVFRVDLRQTGWDSKPFKIRQVVDGKPHFEPTEDRLFDAILIEYPYGRVVSDLPNQKQLVDLFLKPAAQAVPVAFIRADWFVADFSRSPVAKEVRGALDLPDPPAHSTTISVKPSKKEPGIPILPLDSVIKRNMAPDPPPFFIHFETQDPETGLPKTKFKVGERMIFFVRPSKRVYIEIVWTAADGQCQVPDLGTQYLIDANQDKRITDSKGNGYRLAQGVTGKEYLTIFASEQDQPHGRLLKTKLLNDRVFHAFYPLPGVKPESECDPSKIVKKTIEIETRPN
jgi:mono/diheme cytochrome c family protein